MFSGLPRSFILLTGSAWLSLALLWGDRDKRGAGMLFPLPHALLPLLSPKGVGVLS